MLHTGLGHGAGPVARAVTTLPVMDPLLSPDGRWRWNGTAWVTARSGRGLAWWMWQVGLPGAGPWLVFEVVLLLAPVWAPDRSTSVRGVLITAPFYALIVGGPGLIFGVVTKSKGLLIAGTVALAVAAVWAATDMVTSHDGQAGLAVFAIWYIGVPLILLAAIVEWIPYRHASMLATGLVTALALGGLGVGVARITAPTRRAADGETSASDAAERIRTVARTGAVSAPPGGTVAASVQCGRGGAPSVIFTLAVHGGAPPAGDTLTKRLTSLGWDVSERGQFKDYSKRFTLWAARLSELTRTPDGRSVTAHLDVHAPVAADCSTFRKELSGAFS